jgi:hypothetical protein
MWANEAEFIQAVPGGGELLVIRERREGRVLGVGVEDAAGVGRPVVRTKEIARVLRRDAAAERLRSETNNTKAAEFASWARAEVAHNARARDANSVTPPRSAATDRHRRSSDEGRVGREHGGRKGGAGFIMEQLARTRPDQCRVEHVGAQREATRETVW